MAHVDRERADECECANRQRSTKRRQNLTIRDFEDSGCSKNKLDDEFYINVTKRQKFTFVSRPQTVRGVLSMQKR